MGKIGYSSITLTDLTETLPVTLVLETSLDQNIQTKVGNLYTPNFTEEELIITPSLFLGQEDLEIHKNEIFVVPNERQDGYIYYQIGDIENNEEINYYYGSTAESSEVWVDKQGKLHIKRNLTKNLTIEANITNFYLSEHDYRVPQVSEVTPLNILLLEAGSSEYSAIITSSGREYFDEGNTEAITLTALLYKGATPLESGVSYKWDIMTDKDTPDIEEDDGGFDSSDFISREQSITVTRDKVHNTEIFICNISLTDGSGLNFTANKILRDFSDEYSNNLFASSSTILNPKKLSVEITNQVRWQTEIINGEAANQNRFKYEWSILPKEGEQIDLTDDNYKNKTIEVVAGQGDFPKEDFTILGKVTIDNKVTSFSYINIIYREIIYTAELSPKTFFIPVDSTGKITAPFSKEFSFKLLDENKKPVPFEAGDDKISLNKENEDTTSISLIEGSNSFWEDSYLFNLDINYINNNFLERDDPLPYEFSYQYLGQPFQEEINIVKVFKGPQGIQGPQGSQGFSGYTIDLSNEFHAFSGGEGQADANQSTDCLVSAYYGDTALTITEIRLKSTDGPVIYSSSISNSIINYSSINLFISASASTGKEIKITIRTNNSSIEEENSLFLRDIQPILFYITIKDQNNRSVTLLKTFSYTINYNGKSYSLISSHNVIKYSEAEGIYEPSKITVAASVRQESGESTSYTSGKIIYSFDEENWKLYSTSGINDYVNLSNIYLRLYSSRATFSSTITLDEINNNSKYLLDIETIPVLTSLEGYEIGGENLLRWTKTLPIETNKWSKTENDSSTEIGKDGDFSTLVFLNKEHESLNYHSFRAPLIENEAEYLNKTFSFSCYVKAEDWSQAGFGTPITFSIFGLTSFSSGMSGLREGYKLFSLANAEQDYDTVKVHENKENNKWVKISFSFVLSDDFFNSKDTTEGVNSPIKVSEAKYLGLQITKADGTNSSKSISIKKLKLELGNFSTEWSASPYDVTYENINGLNLISSNINSYDFILKAGEEIRLTTSSLNKQTLYTFSWLSSLSSNLNSFGWVARKGDNTILSGGNFSTNRNNFHYTFPEYDEDWNLFFYGGTYNAETKTINYYSLGEIIFSSIKLEKGPLATSFILSDSQINQIVENSINNLSNTIFTLPIIRGSQAEELNFSTAEDFIDYVNYTNDLKAQVEENTAGISVWDDWYNFNGGTWELYKNSIDIVVDQAEGGPFIKIQAVTASGEKLTNNYLKLEENTLGFYSNDTLVASMSQSTLTIDNGILINVRAKENFYIGDLRFRITDSGVGIVWS